MMTNIKKKTPKLSPVETRGAPRVTFTRRQVVIICIFLSYSTATPQITQFIQLQLLIISHG